MATAPVLCRVLAAVAAFASGAAAQHQQVFLNIGVDEVYVVGRDGSGLRRLTHGTDGVR